MEWILAKVQQGSTYLEPVINTLAEKYAGGGHPLASGATVKNWEELDDLLDDMARVVAEYLRENNIKIEN